MFSPEISSTNQKLRSQNKRKWSKSQSNTNKTNPLLYRCYINVTHREIQNTLNFETPRQRKRNAKPTENQLSDTSINYCAEWFQCDICSWLARCFFPICSRICVYYIYIYFCSFFLLMSKLKFYFVIYLLHSFLFFFFWCLSSNTAHFTNCDFCVRCYCSYSSVIVDVIIILSWTVLCCNFFSFFSLCLCFFQLKNQRDTATLRCWNK